jgi:hypothetical protein
MWWQKTVALVVVLAGLVCYPLILLQESGLYIGGGVQPRYLLPMMLMLAGISLLPKDEHRPRLTRFQVVALTSALTMAHSVALYLNLWRYIKGITTPIASLGAYDWWWESLFLSPTAIWAIGSVAFAAVAGYVLSLLARSDDDLAPRTATVPSPAEATSPAVP